MDVLFGWLQLVLVIAAAGLLCGAAVSAAVSTAWLSKLKTFAPRPRAALVGTLLLLPVAAALTAVVVAFAPSALDALGIVSDHCHHHSHHAFHLCFIHGHPPAASGGSTGRAGP